MDTSVRIIYLFYGNLSLTAATNKTTAWDSVKLKHDSYKYSDGNGEMQTEHVKHVNLIKKKNK